MFENAIYRGETLFPIGSRYTIHDEEYMLARVASDRICLVSLANGNRYVDHVSDKTYVEEIFEGSEEIVKELNPTNRFKIGIGSTFRGKMDNEPYVIVQTDEHKVVLLSLETLNLRAPIYVEDPRWLDRDEVDNLFNHKTASFIYTGVTAVFMGETNNG